MRNTLCWIACVWLAETGIAGSPGYLTRVGPVPLRFLSAPNAAAKTALPPLDMGGAAEESANTNRPTAESLAQNRPIDTHSPATPSATPSATPAQPPDNRSPATPASPAPTPLAELVPPDPANAIGPTADKFVHFFMPIPMGTNGTGYVAAPVVFSPPVPANAPPVSRATYLTPPN